MAGESSDRATTPPAHIIDRKGLKISIPSAAAPSGSSGCPRGSESGSAGGYTACSSSNSNPNIREELEAASSATSSTSNCSGSHAGRRAKTHTPIAEKPNDSTNDNNDNNNNDNAASLEWVNSTIQSLAAGKNEADRKRVRSHVMAQRNRKKRQEEVERYQKLKSKSAAVLRPAPASGEATSATSASATAAAPTSAPATDRGYLPSTFVADERAGSASGSETPIKSKTSGSLVPKKRVSKSRKRNVEARGIVKSRSATGTGLARDHGMRMVKRESDVAGYNYAGTPMTATPTSTTEDVEDFRIVKKEDSLTPSPLTSIPPWSYVGQGAGDPFAAMAMKVSGRVQEYIHFYVNVIVPEAYPLCRSPRFRDRYNWGEFAKDSPGLLHGLISGAATSYGLAKGIPPPYGMEHLPAEALHPTTVDSLYHKGEAIRLVNKQLSNPVEVTTNSTVVAITVLLIGEIFKGHYDQILMHLEGLRRVVALRGSLEDFPWPVVCQIKIADIKIATIQLTKPIFPFPRRFHSSPTSTTIDPGPNLSKQGTRFFSPQNNPVFHEDMRSTFSDLIKMVWYAEFIRNSPATSSSSLEDVEEDYFVHQIIYVEHRLLCFPFDRQADPSGDARPENKMECACRFACLLFILNVLWGHFTPMSPLTRTPLMALRHSLEEPRPDLNDRHSPWGRCQDIFVWVMFIGAHSSRDHPERSFFVAEFVKGVRYLGLESCEDVRELLFGFFYTDYAFWESLREVWKEGFGGV